MKKLLFGAALLCAALFSSCGDEYDDTALRNEMEGLKDRIAALEEKLTQEVNTLKGLIAAAEKGLAVGVEETTEGYEVTIGDETFTINHGKDGENGTDGTDGADGTVITVVEVDGVYYWAINGEATEYPVTGNDGEDGEDGEDGAPGQNGYTPEIKDGKWYINGEEVGPAVGENGKDGDSFFKNVTVNEDDTVTFTLAGDTTITVALAKSAKYADVQSIKYVPEYSDGKLTVSYYTGAEDAFVVAKYEVTPKAAAATIAKYAKDASMQAVYTKTRAEAGEVVVLPVTAIEAEEGVITVTATATELAAEFFAGSLEASVRFAVQDDLSGNASGYVAAVAEKVEMPEFTATAVAEGYQAAKVAWTEIPGAAYYEIKVGEDVVAKAEGVTEYVVENLTAANNYAFTVVACAANDAELVSGATAEIQIYSLTNRPEPVITLADGVLTVANAAINPSATKVDNLHIYGALLEAEIYFYKDGATEPSHTAVGSYLDSYPGVNLPLSYTEKKLKNNIAGAYTAWKWDGAAEATKTVPEFEAGVWTVKYKAGYHTFVNASYGSDRLLFSAPTDALQTMVYREGDSDLTFTVEKTWNVYAAIDNGTEYIKELFRQWPCDYYNYAWNGLRSVNGQLETVTLTWDEIEADKVVVEYLGETVEVTTGLPFHIVTGLKTSPVEFTVTAYQGETAIANAKVTSDVYTLPETASGTFNATYNSENKTWTITGEDFNTTQYATWNCSFNLYEKGSETPVFENPITKNGKNESFAYISYICRGNGWVQASKDTFVGFHVGDGAWDQGKTFTGLKGNTEYEVRFELSVWPYIYDPNGAETDLEKPQWDLVKALMSDDKATNHGAIKLKGTTSFTTGEGPQPAKLNAIAAIDEGTEYIKELFRQWPCDYYNYSWYGNRSVNGMLESVKLSWDAIDGVDKVVIAYGDQTVEITDGSTEAVIEGLKTSPVEFTITAYAGAEAVNTETVTSNVYVLPETASGTFSASYNADADNWTIKGEDFNTTQYATWNCSFNLYEKGSETPVFENPITKNGNNQTFAYISYICRGNGWVQASKDTFVGFHIGDGNWDQGTTFTGLKHSTEYEVRFELNVWPYIYDPNGAETDINKPQWDLVKALMTTDKATNHGAIKLEGTTSFTTEAAPIPEKNWDHVMGDYTAEKWESPYHLTDMTLYKDRGLGYFSKLYGVYAANNLPDGNGGTLGEPRDGQKYAICYGYYNFFCFNIGSEEINPETMQPQAGTGCYALTDLIDRPAATDMIIANYSYYDEKEGAFYVSVKLRGIFDMIDPANGNYELKEGCTDREHTGKLHTRVDFAQ